MRSIFVAINAHYMHTSLALREIRAAYPEGEYMEFHINQPFRKIADALIALKPDAVGLSCYIWNAELALRLARALKAALPGVVVALGGPEVEYDAGDYLTRHAEADYVLCGEGETVWPGFVRALNAGNAEGAPGVCSRVDGRIVRGPDAPLSRPDDWRYPYEEGEIARLDGRLTYIETSRGCPFRCAYCLSRLQNVRQLPAERALEFLTRMADEGARVIKLVDRTFNADGRRAVSIWRALIERADRWPQRPVFHFEITARLLDEEALCCLESAPRGLFQLEIGIQSTSERVLNAVERRDDHSRIAYVVDRLRRAGNMHLHVDLIAGLPGETWDSFARSFDDAWAMGAHRLQLGFLKLLRGSALRDEAAALGLRFDPDPPYEIEATPDIGADGLIRLRRIEELLEAYCNSGRYECTMRLLAQGRSPFALLDALREYFEARGLFSRGLSERDRAAALYDFGRALPGADDILLSACIRHDCISRGGRLDLPGALQSTMSESDRAALRDYVSPVRGQWIERYCVDMAAFARGGEAVLRACTILYDPKKGIWFEREG